MVTHLPQIYSLTLILLLQSKKQNTADSMNKDSLKKKKERGRNQEEGRRKRGVKEGEGMRRRGRGKGEEERWLT